MENSETEQKELLVSSAQTDRGRHRSENQDSFCCIIRPQFSFYAIADGMGGIKGGAAASALALQTISHALNGTESSLNSQGLVLAAQQANQAVHQRGEDDPSLHGMGTTLVALAFSEHKIFLLNVGDSRLYRWRSGTLSQLSSDHTLVQELFNAGTITREQAQNNPIGHMLSRSLGPSASVEVECLTFDGDPLLNDVYLLCSDGLHGQVTPDEISRGLQSVTLGKKTAQDALRQLIDECNHRGGPDNISGIIVHVTRTFPAQLALISGANPPYALSGHFCNSWSSSVAVPENDSAPTDKIQVLAPPLKKTWRRLPMLGAAAACLVLGAITGIYVNGEASHIRSFWSRQHSEHNSAIGNPTLDVAPSTNTDAKLLPPTAYENPEAEAKALDQSLAQMTTDLEASMRRLSLWRTRQRRASGADFGLAAADVAVNSADVRQKKMAFEELNAEYLSAAESLVYGPTDDAQESKVATLARDRKALFDDLKEAVQRAINGGITETAGHIADASEKRELIIRRLQELGK